MDRKDILVNLKALNSAIADYLDRMDMDCDEGDGEKKPVKKVSPKGKEA